MSDRIYKFYAQLIRKTILPLSMTASTISVFALLFFLFSKKTSWSPVFLGILASLIGGFIAFVMAQTFRMVRTHRTVFFSYTHQDADFVMKLAKDLTSMNIEPLIDRLELKVGENIRQAVDEMIDRSDYFLFVVSENSMKSDWAMKELEQAMSRKKKVLPVVLHVESVPPELSGVFYADFSENYETGIGQLQKTFGAR